VSLSFYKYHGTGNDFILIDDRQGSFNADTSIIKRLCSRRFGIGADGLITLYRRDGFDFGMKYYNSDGCESSMCGNGGRCIVAFADFLSPGRDAFTFFAADGMHTGTILERNGNVYRIKLSMKDVMDYSLSGEDYILDTGSPHFVRFVNDIGILDVRENGRMIRNIGNFQPGGINVNFVKVEGDRIIVRTYERGVEDETLSCGTGVTASALAFAASNNLDEGIVSIHTAGGILKLYFERNGKGFNNIFLEGPAEKVFEGITTY
jgi:diaminopimelate epimerase